MEIEWDGPGGEIVPGLGMPARGDRFVVSRERGTELIRDKRAKAVRGRGAPAKTGGADEED